MNLNQLNQEIVKGKDHRINIVITDANDVPVDITGWTGFAYSIKKRYTDVAKEVALAVGTGITMVDASNGSFKIVIPKTTTVDFDFLRGVHDLEAINDDSETIEVFRGIVTIIDEVST